MTERLSATGSDGRAKSFRAPTIEHVEEFLQFFDQRNVLGDQAMKGLVDRLRKAMKGISADAIRDDERFCAEVTRQMGQFTAELDKLVTTAPRKTRVRGNGEAS